jgi:AcrR family transcriptional regulator
VNPGRNELRKAATHRKIAVAANALFLEKGYARTSMEEIATSADVAIRTLYLHYDSKAAILLSYFDAWMDAFVPLVADRAPGEPVDVAFSRALAAMAVDDWNDDKGVDEVVTMPPVLEFIGSGSPEIAGHILQRWVAAQEQLAEAFRGASGVAPDSLLPQFEASAVFSAWLVAILDFRARFLAGGPNGSSYAAAEDAMRAYAAGLSASASAAAASRGNPAARG